jgi:hypothetical protein
MTKEYIISGYHKIITIVNSCKRVEKLNAIKDWIDNFIDRTLPYYDKMPTQDQIDIMANKVLCHTTLQNKYQDFINATVNTYFRELDRATQLSSPSELIVLYTKYILAENAQGIINEYIEVNGMQTFLKRLGEMFIKNQGGI